MPHATDFDLDVSSVLLAHRFIISPGHDVTGYCHGRSMQGVVCPISGRAEYLCADGQRIVLEAGSVAFLPAAAAYRVRTADDEPFDHYTVNFLGDAARLPEWMPKDAPYVLHPRDGALCRTRFEELVEIWQRMRTGYRMQTKARLVALLGDLVTESMAGQVDPAAYHRTLPARRWMETHIEESMTLDSLAELCGMSVGSFRRAFAEVYGLPPVSYLMRLRIEKAKEYLLLGFSLEDTAARCGFANSNYFIRYFRNAEGMTPGRFRKSF